MSDVRSVTITGGAIGDYSNDGGATAKKRGASRKKKQEGGMQQGVDTNAGSVGGPHLLGYQGQAGNPVIKVDMHGPLPAPPTASTASTVSTASATASTASTASTVSAPISPVSAHPEYTPSHYGGATKQIKVELKKRAPSRKVQLNPKKAEVAPKKKPQTKKVRKITLGVSSLHKRMTRAKKVHKRIKDMPIDKLREHLIAKKLIKATSKAPEAVLRQIAADSQMVAKKIL